MSSYQTQKKVFSYIERHEMLKEQDVVVAGVSGGADSVCLLQLLLEYSQTVPISLHVVHVNHKIREDAGDDAGYVEQLCRQAEIPFYLFEEDVEQVAQREGISSEEAGRMVRYGAFHQVAERIREQTGREAKIAVAHNQNDRAETMLFHLFRGSGLKGLAGILPVRDNLIRPLLCLKREEIEEYLKEKGITYQTDSTNHTDDYTRNRIRHHVIPYVEDSVVSGAVEHMNSCADRLSLAEDYLQQETYRIMKRCILRKPDAGVFIPAREFQTLHPYMQGRVLYEILCEYSPGKKDISSVHVRLLTELFEAQTGKKLDLAFGVTAVRTYEGVELHCLEKKPETVADGILLTPKLLENESFECDFCGYHLKFTLLSGDILLKNPENIPQNQYTKWIDYDKITELPKVRTRRTGDQLSLRMGEGKVGHKSVKEYMITEKIPAADRDLIPLLADGSQIIWLIGYRLGEAYKTDSNTKRILQVQWIK